MDIPSHPPSSGRAVDIVFGAIIGLLTAIAGPTWLIYAASHLPASGVSAPTASRSLVWCILMAPPALYFSIFGAYGATSAWLGMPAISLMQRIRASVPMEEMAEESISFLMVVVRGVTGGLIALIPASVILAAILVISFVVMFLGPGIAEFIGGIVIVLAIAALAAVNGAVMGALIYLRKTYGWAVGIAAGAVLIVASSLVIDHFLS